MNRPGVRADAVVPFPADRARALLWRALAVQARERAGDIEVDLDVGPGRNRLLRKHVAALVTAADLRQRTYVLPLRWRPVGRLAACYPALDGAVGITAIDETTCLLSFAGGYVPPLGRIGSAADRAGLHRVAQSTAQGVADRLARVVTSPPIADPGKGRP